MAVFNCTLNCRPPLQRRNDMAFLNDQLDAQFFYFIIRLLQSSTFYGMTNRCNNVQ